MPHAPVIQPTGRRRTTSATLLAAVASVATFAAPAAAQAPTTQELLDRIEAQDRRIDELKQQQESGASNASFPPAKQGGLPLTASYDNGFRLRSTDPASPFELKIDGRMQFRFQGFDADNNAPVVNSDLSAFEIERGRLEFAGTFLDANTHFFINLDADTDDNHQVIFHDFWINYDFAKGHSLYVGKAFVPGSRDWIAGSTSTHLIDRSLATTFFRPDRTLGVWAIGKMCGDVNYRIMVGNGLRTSDLSSSEVDSNFAYAASFWIDPLAAYGKGYADLEHHEDLALRLGTSMSYTRQDEGQGAANREARGVDLSNGMRLTDLGVAQYDFHMAAADAAVKYQGFAANTELFYRWIDEINLVGGPAARQSYYDWGGYCDAGFMIVPKTLEPVVRVSTIQGAMGDSWEYAAGVNYYVDGTHTNKLSIDATKLDGAPTGNSGPGYRVGDDGWMFRIQWQIAF